MKIVAVPSGEMNQTGSKLFSRLTFEDVQRYKMFFPGPDQFCAKSESSEYEHDGNFGLGGGSEDSENDHPDSCENSSASCSKSYIDTGGSAEDDEPYGIDVRDTKSTDKTRSTRKPLRPFRSATRNDPSFRGVTFKVQANLKRKGRDNDSQLVIDSFFSVRKRQRLDKSVVARTSRKIKRSASYPHESGSSSGSDQEAKVSQYRHSRSTSGKQCASCSTRSTPLWRDAEDGTPLCNACGIRYKKYHVRCSYCWHIPKKDSKSFPNCARCGDYFRVSSMSRDRDATSSFGYHRK